jgi:septal ring-binding cell division protein DamX
LAFAVVYEGDPNRNDVHGGSHAAPMIGKVLREYFKDPAKAKPVRQLDENGNEIEPPEIPKAQRKAAPVNDAGDQETAPLEPTQAPAAPPSKATFWKRIFG